jgi:NADH dehydrogenase
MSSLGADEPRVRHAQSKAEGEKRARAAFLALSCSDHRWSSAEDDFFNRFAALSRFSPVLPLIGGGEREIRAVFVGDAVGLWRVWSTEAMPMDARISGRSAGLEFPSTDGIHLDTIGRKRLLAPVPWAIAKIQASILGLVPSHCSPPISGTAESDNGQRAGAARGRTLEGLGIVASGTKALCRPISTASARPVSSRHPRGIPE